MKKHTLIALSLVFIAFTSVNAQLTEPTKDIKTVTHLTANHYSVVYHDVDGNKFQEGQYLKVGERYKAHGVWKLYDRNTFELVTSAKYDKGEQVWVETIIDGQILHVDKHELKVKRLEERIAILEKQIESLD